MSLASPVATGPPAQEVPASKAKRQVTTAPAPGAATRDSGTRGRVGGATGSRSQARRGPRGCQGGGDIGKCRLAALEG